MEISLPKEYAFNSPSFSVIVPTMISVLQAIEYYERQGGTASVFINDGGMQTIEPELADVRKQSYAENNIGYCARLPNKKSTGPKKSWLWFRKTGHYPIM
jgi:hypothetical protein